MKIPRLAQSLAVSAFCILNSWAAHAQDCSLQLVSPTLKTDPVAVYKQVLKHMAAKRQQGTITIEVPMGNLARPFVDEAERRLLQLIAEGKAEGQRQDLLSFIATIRQADFPYIEVLRLAEGYAKFRTCIVKPAFCFNGSESLRTSSTFVHDARQLLSYGDFFYWPSFETLKLKEFIATRSVRLYNLEIRDTSAHADGSDMDPELFLMHDKNHGREMAIADARLVAQVGNEEAFQQTAQAWENIEARWNNALEIKRVKIVLFSYLHENGGYNLVELTTVPAHLLPLYPQALQFIIEELQLPASHSNSANAAVAQEVLATFLR